MKNLLKLTAALALLLASWMAPTSVSAVPYYCGCDWCSKSVYAQTGCQNPYSETRTTCGNFYWNYCVPQF